MNWDAIAFDWNQIRAFLATAHEGSFSAAARALKSTQPTVGRQVSALEADLGVTLFERTARGPALTAAGRELLSHVRAMGDAATRVSMTAAVQSQDVEGAVSITTADLFAASILPPIVQRIRSIAPGIRLSIFPANEVRDLTRREADIAIRHVRPEQADLFARRLNDFTAAIYASSAYLDRVGRPQEPAELGRLDFIGTRDNRQMIAMLADLGATADESAFVMGTDSGVVLYQLMRAGMGASFMPDVLCRNTPGVERVLPDMEPIRFPVWLVTHRELHTSRRIRVVFDTLADALQSPDLSAMPL